jgi:Tfp pilus assembly protein PilZ
MGQKALNVALEVEHGDEVLQRMYPNGRLGGLRVDGAAPAVVGARVDLLLWVKQPRAQHFNAHTRLAWVRHRGTPRLRECFGLDFLPGAASGRERLLGFLHGQVDTQKLRAHERFSVEWPVVLNHAGVARRETLADLSFGGAFLRTHTVLSLGSPLELNVRAPGALLPIKLAARVVWVRRSGDDAGMGLEFQNTGRGTEKLRKLVERLSRSGPA